MFQSEYLSAKNVNRCQSSLSLHFYLGLKTIFRLIDLFVGFINREILAFLSHSGDSSLIISSISSRLRCLYREVIADYLCCFFLHDCLLLFVIQVQFQQMPFKVRVFISSVVLFEIIRKDFEYKKVFFFFSDIILNVYCRFLKAPFPSVVPPIELICSLINFVMSFQSCIGNLVKYSSSINSFCTVIDGFYESDIPYS